MEVIHILVKGHQLCGPAVGSFNLICLFQAPNTGITIILYMYLDFQVNIISGISTMRISLPDLKKVVMATIGTLEHMRKKNLN